MSIQSGRAERFGRHFFRTLGYDSVSDNFEPPPPGTSNHVLFFGHVGSGKSTELARLSRTTSITAMYGWRCVLDAHRIDTPESLLKAAIGCFPRFVVT